MKKKKQRWRKNKKKSLKIEFKKSLKNVEIFMKKNR